MCSLKNTKHEKLLKNITSLSARLLIKIVRRGDGFFFLAFLSSVGRLPTFSCRQTNDISYLGKIRGANFTQLKKMLCYVDRLHTVQDVCCSAESVDGYDP